MKKEILQAIFTFLGSIFCKYALCKVHAKFVKIPSLATIIVTFRTYFSNNVLYKTLKKIIYYSGLGLHDWPSLSLGTIRSVLVLAGYGILGASGPVVTSFMKLLTR